MCPLIFLCARVLVAHAFERHLINEITPDVDTTREQKKTHKMFVNKKIVYSVRTVRLFDGMVVKCAAFFVSFARTRLVSQGL